MAYTLLRPFVVTCNVANNKHSLIDDIEDGYIQNDIKELCVHSFSSADTQRSTSSADIILLPTCCVFSNNLEQLIEKFFRQSTENFDLRHPFTGFPNVKRFKNINNGFFIERHNRESPKRFHSEISAQSLTTSHQLQVRTTSEKINNVSIKPSTLKFCCLVR